MSRTRYNSIRLCWIDRLDSFFPRLHPAILAIVFGLGVYSIAAFPLLISGSARRVFDFPLVLGVVGIVWSLFFYWYGSQNYTEHLKSFESAIEHSALSKYRDLRSAHIRKLGNDRSHFVVSLSVWLILAILVIGDFYGRLPGKLWGSLRVFPQQWYTPELRPYCLATIIIVGLPVALLVWTLGRLIILHTLFLERVSHLEFVPSQHICFIRFRNLLRINMLAAFGWSVGVALFGLLFLRTHRPAQIAFLGLLGTVATAAFFLPTWSFEGKLRKIGLSRVNTLVAATLKEMKHLPADPTRWTELFMLEEQLSQHTKDLSFAIMRTYVGTLLTTFVIPVLAAVIGAVAAKFMDAPIIK